jgi:hypothetical protein
MDWLLVVVIILAAATDILFGLFPLLIQKRRGRKIVWFSVLSFVAGLWTISNLLIVVPPHGFWLRNAYATGGLVLSVGFFWALSLGNFQIRKWAQYIIGIPAASLFVLTYIPGPIIERVDEVTIGGFNGKFGPLFPIYAAFAVVMVAAVLITLIVGYKKSSGLEHLQIRYAILGAAGFGIISSLVSFILPLFDVDALIPLDSASSVILIASLGYAISRHRLYDIRVIITRSLLYTTTVAIVALALTLITSITTQLFKSQLRASSFVLSIIASLIIVLGLDPLKRMIAKVTERFLFSTRINYANLLQEFGAIVANELELRKLMEHLQTLL